MTTKIHLTADAEPLELHGVADAGHTQVFGVHLAAQVLGETEAVGETRTAAFLDGLPGGSFLLLDVSGGAVANMGVEVKTMLSRSPLVVSTSCRARIMIDPRPVV